MAQAGAASAGAGALREKRTWIRHPRDAYSDCQGNAYVLKRRICHHTSTRPLMFGISRCWDMRRHRTHGRTPDTPSLMTLCFESCHKGFESVRLISEFAQRVHSGRYTTSPVSISSGLSLDPTALLRNCSLEPISGMYHLHRFCGLQMVAQMSPQGSGTSASACQNTCSTFKEFFVCLSQAPRCLSEEMKVRKRLCCL
jgi:hypothetical protein